MSPEDMGGVPAVMPSNDWWKTASDLGGQILSTYENIQLARLNSGVAAPGGRISSNIKNLPPGGQGANPQANVPGSAPQPFSWQRLGLGGSGALVGVIVVVVLVVMLARR